MANETNKPASPNPSPKPAEHGSGNQSPQPRPDTSRQELRESQELAERRTK